MTGRDFGRELYPFLYPDTEKRSTTPDASVLAQVADSTLQKSAAIASLRRQVIQTCVTQIVEAGARLAQSLQGGGMLLTFGNGGSATDAEDAALDLCDPPNEAWRAYPAMALTNDVGVVTALSNDVGFTEVFSRQIVAHGRTGDVALGFSTSGTSRSVVSGLAEARNRGLVTVAMTGYDGGELGGAGVVDVHINAPSDFVPRIQEAHATCWHAVLDITHAILRREPS